LNATYPEEELWERIVGKPVNPAIFDNTDDISPVTDPNIFSEAQRYAQMQAVMQLMADPTVPYNRVEGHRRMLMLLNVPNPDSLLPELPKPRRADAVQENVFCVSGIPLKAYPEQDHLAHIETHLRFILSPLLGAGPAFSGQQLAPLLAHCGEHYSMHYPVAVAQAQAVAVTQGALLPDEPKERTQAVGMSGFDQVNGQQLQMLLQMMQQAQQLVQSKTPPPPQDPQIQATMQVAQMEDARAKAEPQGKMQLEQNKLQGEMAKNQIEMQMKQQAQMHSQKMEETKLQIDHQLSMMQAQQEAKMKEMAQQVEMMKNEADNKQKQMTELLKNRDDNQTQILIAQMKEQLAQVLPQQQQAPQDDSTLKEMQRLLGELKEAKTNTALETVVQGLQSVIGGQQQHQERMLQAASPLLAGE
jgi:hypothetical protein